MKKLIYIDFRDSLSRDVVLVDAVSQHRSYATIGDYTKSAQAFAIAWDQNAIDWQQKHWNNSMVASRKHRRMNETLDK